jgi:hypothetical protein
MINIRYSEKTPSRIIAEKDRKRKRAASIPP